MTRKNNSPRRILIDTNVSFNDFLHRFPKYGLKNATVRKMENRRFCAQAIKYVGQNAKFKTFITDFSVVKLISLMDSNKVPKSEKIAELDSLLSQNTVITLGGTQLAETVNRYRYTDEVKDLEDALQYDLAQKMDCTHIITLNRRDFQVFNVPVIAPSKIRSIV